MDITELAHTVTLSLIPFLPYLSKLGDKAAEEAAKHLGADAWEHAKALWSRFHPQIAAKPAAAEALQRVTDRPGDARVNGALELQIEDMLAENAALKTEVEKLVEGAKSSGVTVTASGERSVAIGGNVSGSTIVTGNENQLPPKG